MHHMPLLIRRNAYLSFIFLLVFEVLIHLHGLHLPQPMSHSNKQISQVVSIPESMFQSFIPKFFRNHNLGFLSLWYWVTIYPFYRYCSMVDWYKNHKFFVKKCFQKNCKLKLDYKALLEMLSYIARRTISNLLSLGNTTTLFIKPFNGKVNL